METPTSTGTAPQPEPIKPWKQVAEESNIFSLPAEQRVAEYDKWSQQAIAKGIRDGDFDSPDTFSQFKLLDIRTRKNLASDDIVGPSDEDILADYKSFKNAFKSTQDAFASQKPTPEDNAIQGEVLQGKRNAAFVRGQMVFNPTIVNDPQKYREAILESDAPPDIKMLYAGLRPEMEKSATVTRRRELANSIITRDVADKVVNAIQEGTEVFGVDVGTPQSPALKKNKEGVWSVVDPEYSDVETSLLARANAKINPLADAQYKPLAAINEYQKKYGLTDEQVQQDYMEALIENAPTAVNRWVSKATSVEDYVKQLDSTVRVKNKDVAPEVRVQDPNLFFDEEGYNAAVDKANAPDEAKNLAKEARTQFADVVAGDIYNNLLANRDDFREDYAKDVVERKDMAKAITRYYKDKKDQAWYDDVGEFIGQTGTALEQGGMNVIMTPSAVLGMFGSVKDAEDVRYATMVQNGQMQTEEAVANRTGGAGAIKLTGDVARILPDLAVQMAIGIMSGGALSYSQAAALSARTGLSRAAARTAIRQAMVTGEKAALKTELAKLIPNLSAQAADDVATGALEVAARTASNNPLKGGIGTQRAIGSAYAGLTSAGSTFGQVYTEVRNMGKSPEESIGIARTAGITAGAITGALTHAFGVLGRGGVEDFASMGRKAGEFTIRDIMKSGVYDVLTTQEGRQLARSIASGIAKDALHEGVEEGLDQALNLISQYATNPSPEAQNRKVSEVINESLYATLLGGIAGGGANVVGQARATAPGITAQQMQAEILGADATVAPDVAPPSQPAPPPIAPTTPPTAPAPNQNLSPEIISGIQSGVASIDPDMRELFADIMERKLQKKGSLDWKDVPSELNQQLDTASFSSVKAGLLVSPMSVINLVRGTQNKAPAPAPVVQSADPVVQQAAETAKAIADVPDTSQTAAALAALANAAVVPKPEFNLPEIEAPAEPAPEAQPEEEVVTPETPAPEAEAPVNAEETPVEPAPTVAKVELEPTENMKTPARDATKPEQMTPEEWLVIENDPQKAALLAADSLRLAISENKPFNTKAFNKLFGMLAPERQLMSGRWKDNPDTGMTELRPESELGYTPSSQLSEDRYLSQNTPLGGWNFRASGIRGRTKTQGREDYAKALKLALKERGSLNADGVKKLKLTLPPGYVKQGELYVYQPEKKAEVKTEPVDDKNAAAKEPEKKSARKESTPVLKEYPELELKFEREVYPSGRNGGWILRESRSGIKATSGKTKEEALESLRWTLLWQQAWNKEYPSIFEITNKAIKDNKIDAEPYTQSYKVKPSKAEWKELLEQRLTEQKKELSEEISRARYIGARPNTEYATKFISEIEQRLKDIDSYKEPQPTEPVAEKPKPDVAAVRAKIKEAGSTYDKVKLIEGMISSGEFIPAVIEAAETGDPLDKIPTSVFVSREQNFTKTVSIDRISAPKIKVTTPEKAAEVAISKDETRFILNGVFLDAESQRVVATDGKLLIAIPAKVDGESRVVFNRNIKESKNNKAVKKGDVIIGSYPNWKGVVPEPKSKKKSVNTDEALRATTVLLGAKKPFNRDDSLVAVIEIEKGYFNPEYIKNAITGILQSGAKGIVSQMDSDTSPLLLTGDNGAFAVVMPLRIPEKGNIVLYKLGQPQPANPDAVQKPSSDAGVLRQEGQSVGLPEVDQGGRGAEQESAKQAEEVKGEIPPKQQDVVVFMDEQNDEIEERQKPKKKRITPGEARKAGIAKQIEILGIQSNDPDSIIGALKKIAAKPPQPHHARIAKDLLSVLEGSGTSIVLVASNDPRIKKGDERVNGWYDPQTNTAYINLDGPHELGIEETILHELVHASGEKVIRNPQTDAQKRILGDLQKQMEAATKNAISLGQSVLKTKETDLDKLIALAASKNNYALFDILYGVSSLSEYHAHATTSKAFQRFLSEYKEGSKRNFFERFVNSLTRLLSGQKTTEGSDAEKSYATLLDLMRENKGDVRLSNTDVVESEQAMSVEDVIAEPIPESEAAALDALPDDATVEDIADVAPKLIEQSNALAIKFKDFASWSTAATKAFGSKAIRFLETIWTGLKSISIAAIIGYTSTGIDSAFAPSVQEIRGLPKEDLVSVAHILSKTPKRQESVTISLPDKRPTETAKPPTQKAKTTEEKIAESLSSFDSSVSNYVDFIDDKFESEILGSVTLTPAMKAVAPLVGEMEGNRQSGPNKTLAKIFEVGGILGSQDEVPWCAMFISHGLNKAGIPTQNVMASQFLSFGKRTSSPKVGDIVVFNKRNDDNTISEKTAGHVGFFIRESGDFVLVLNGNVGDSVAVTALPKRRVMQYRSAPTVRTDVVQSRARGVTTEMDAAFADAYAKGDLQAAQKMVDAAAKGVGLIGPVSHATDAKFNEFKPTLRGRFGKGMYFSDKYLSYRGGINMRVYLENPQITEIKSPWKRDSPKWTPETHNEYFVKDPISIKSADAFTFDDAGELIPLSQRFNPASQDIRFSRARGVESDSAHAELERRFKAGDKDSEKEAKALVEETAKQAGWTEKAYHGTGSPFTIFDSGRGGSVTNARSARLAFFLVDDPTIAKQYAELAVMEGKGDSERIISAFVKGNLKTVDHGGKEYEERKFSTEIQQALDEGYDGVKFVNTDDSVFRELIGYEPIPEIVITPYKDGSGVTLERGDFRVRAEYLPNGFTRIIKPSGSTELVKSRDQNLIRDKFDEMSKAVVKPKEIYKNQRHTVFAVFDPNQIKSADAFTYDDDGNLIPLSERFTEQSPDIRYSKARGIVSDAVVKFAPQFNVVDAPDGPSVEFDGRSVMVNPEKLANLEEYEVQDLANRAVIAAIATPKDPIAAGIIQQTMDVAAYNFDSESRKGIRKSLADAHRTAHEFGMAPLAMELGNRLFEFGGATDADVRKSMARGTASDEEYLAAVEAGDMETAQKMVDAAARAAGYDPGWYQGGSGSIQGDVFDPNRRQRGNIFGAGYFSDSVRVAWYYATHGGFKSERIPKRKRQELAPDRKPRLSAFSVKAVKPFSGNLSLSAYKAAVLAVRGSAGWAQELEATQEAADAEMEEREIDEQLAFEQMLEAADYAGTDTEAFGSNKGLLLAFSDWEVGSKILELGGYDSVKYSDEESQDVIGVASKTVVPLSPSQIKSADPVTRDDAGNVIPLSQRFQSESPDIRYSRARGVDLVAYVPRNRTAIRLAIDKFISGFRSRGMVSQEAYDALRDSDAFKKENAAFVSFIAKDFTNVTNKLFGEGGANLENFRVFSRDATTGEATVSSRGFETRQKAEAFAVTNRYKDYIVSTGQDLINQALGSNGPTLREDVRDAIEKLTKKGLDDIAKSIEAYKEEYLDYWNTVMMQTQPGMIDPAQIATLRERKEQWMAALRLRSEEQKKLVDDARKKAVQAAIADAKNRIVQQQQFAKAYLPDNLVHQIERAREKIDELSTRLAGINWLMEGSELQMVIEGLNGVYVTRSYEAFETSDKAAYVAWLNEAYNALTNSDQVYDPLAMERIMPLVRHIKNGIMERRIEDLKKENDQRQVDAIMEDLMADSRQVTQVDRVPRQPIEGTEYEQLIRAVAKRDLLRRRSDEKKRFIRDMMRHLDAVVGFGRNIGNRRKRVVALRKEANRIYNERYGDAEQQIIADMFGRPQGLQWAVMTDDEAHDIANVERALSESPNNVSGSKIWTSSISGTKHSSFYAAVNDDFQSNLDFITKAPTSKTGNTTATANDWRRLGDKILEHKNDVPAFLRTFLGEKDNPLLRVSDTILKQSHLIAVGELYRGIAEIGEKAGWLVHKEMQATDRDKYGTWVPLLSSKDADQGYENNPLKGMYADPVMAKAIDTLLAANQPSNSAFKVIAFVVGASLWNVTAGSVRAIARNLYSLPIFLMNSGILGAVINPTRWPIVAKNIVLASRIVQQSMEATGKVSGGQQITNKGFKLADKFWTGLLSVVAAQRPALYAMKGAASMAEIAGRIKEQPTGEAFQEVYLKAVRLGVANDNVQKEAIHRLLDIEEQAIRKPKDKNMGRFAKALKLEGAVGFGSYLLGTMKSTLQQRSQLYGAPDDFTKIMAWLNEMDTQANIHAKDDAQYKEWVGEDGLFSKMPDEFVKKAADNVTNLIQSHSRVWAHITQMKKAGFGTLMAPFAAARAEFYRNAANAYIIAFEEMRSKNKKEQMNGGIRFASALMAHLAMGNAIGAVVKTVFSAFADDDEVVEGSPEYREAVRKLGPEYAKNKNATYILYKNGTFDWVDLSFANPFAFVWDSITAARRGATEKDVEDNIVVAMSKEILEENIGTFAKPQIALDAFAAIRTGYDPVRGVKIWDSQADSFTDKLEKSVSYYLKQAGAPGDYKDAMKIWKASRGVEENGRQYKVGTEVGAVFLGTSIRTVNITDALEQKLAQAKDTLGTRITPLYKAPLRNANDVEMEDVALAVQQYAKAHDQAVSAMQKSYKAAETLLRETPNAKTLLRNVMSSDRVRMNQKIERAIVTGGLSFPEFSDQTLQKMGDLGKKHDDPRLKVAVDTLKEYNQKKKNP